MKVWRNLLCAALWLSMALTACEGAGHSQPEGSVTMRTLAHAGTVDGCIQGDFNPYYGVLHAHTSYSDGELTPADAFAYGRDQGGLDILIITDHLEQLYLTIPVADKWGKCREQANAAYAPGSFIADCGYEYGSGFAPVFQSTGHNNVFFVDYLFPAIQLDFHQFYQSLAACPTCIGQFNHPGDPVPLNWNGFEYHADVDEKMNLFEFNSTGAWDFFFQALDAGWHVSPMNNQDNHDANWGTRNEDRSGFYLADLTRESLKSAMVDRRSFMTTDKNAAIKATALDGCWMGSILTGSFPTTIPIQVEVFDLDAGDGLSAIELYGPGKELLGSFDCAGSGTCQATFTVDASSMKYFVAKAIEADGGWLVAAPIWIEPEVAPCYALALSHTGTGSDPVASPARSVGCSTGKYVAGTAVSLTAAPGTGWLMGGWTGTDDDASTLKTNTVTMPAGDHAAAANYTKGACGTGAAGMLAAPAATLWIGRRRRSRR